MALTEYLRRVAQGDALTIDEAESAMMTIMSGEADQVQLGGLLVGLAARGETTDELAGFARAMRANAVPVTVPGENAVDLCGTGGDDSNTFNISTAAALVCAGAGITVAKHGNRSVSSSCGSADVLEELGVVVDLGPKGVERCLEEAGIGFMYAPTFHPAMRHVMPTRRALGVRTAFNLLGPVCNPAAVKRQVVGAYSVDAARTIASVLERLGMDRFITVHSSDGLDEFSLNAPAHVYEYNCDDGEIVSRVIEPNPDLRTNGGDVLVGGDAQTNADVIRSVLAGDEGPHRDIVVLNAAYAIVVSDLSDDLQTALEIGRASIDSGAALAALEKLSTVSGKMRGHDS